MSEFEVDSDRDRIDVDAAWAFLSTEAYWARWRTREDFATQVASAWRLIGAYDRATGAQVGFARATSDGVAFAFLSDLHVVRSARGQGIAKAMVRAMIDDGPGARFRWMLHTEDAHDLYRPFGFTEPDGTYLERAPRFT
ncbi:Histone acetyltransferase HPA2 and related acetyltransferases [Alloactinosynnema sp. L-07]|uniref:GNAT family N-acetyltransferase n=1 Tax=Alloactinosynnema sp. L-07 TaxID=1653480 RepID=UPI00065EF048|nr:GNAT family N-acetyltransferase [Alloactinosynnema sp. L-07]CRK55606.1 Histone acetyltransferase HPA2 and related acetyltransferases [Alloactinosynnema sp. L-07]